MKWIFVFLICTIVGIAGTVSYIIGAQDRNISNNIISVRKLIDHVPYGCRKITFEGHEYISAYRAGIVHSASCPCQSEGGNE